MDIAEEIIQYQKKKNSNDTQMAFEIHMSVERLHNIKGNGSIATDSEKQKIRDFINMHR